MILADLIGKLERTRKLMLILRVQVTEPLHKILNIFVIGTLLDSGFMEVTKYMRIVMRPIVDFAHPTQSMALIGFGKVHLIVFLARPADKPYVFSMLEIAIGLQLFAVDAQNEGIGEV